MIILYEHHLQQLEQMLGEIPWKHVKPIAGFLAHIRAEQQRAQAEVAKAEEAAPEAKAE